PRGFGAVVVLGAVAFGALGILRPGALGGELPLAAANAAYLVLLVVGGMVVPLSELPSGLRAVARILPSGALTEALVGTLTAGRSVPVHAWLVLAAWAVITPVLAAPFFKWE